MDGKLPSANGSNKSFLFTRSVSVFDISTHAHLTKAKEDFLAGVFQQCQLTPKKKTRTKIGHFSSSATKTSFKNTKMTYLY